jgi:hypothetical protein
MRGITVSREPHAGQAIRTASTSMTSLYIDDPKSKVQSPKSKVQSLIGVSDLGPWTLDFGPSTLNHVAPPPSLV